MNSILKLNFCFALLLALTACGGGSSETTDPATQLAGKATVGLILTDASADDYDHAYTTVTSVELLGDAGHQLIFSGEQEVDLLSLTDTVTLFAVNENVDPGTFSKVRMHASGLTLVKDNADGSTTETYADLVANGKIDLNPRGPFSIAAGDVVFISFDWDVNESLKLTQAGNGKVNMRPVVFVNIGARPAFKQGLVRVHGIVEMVPTASGNFRICSRDVATELPTTPVLNALCLDIFVDDKTGVFGEDGMPAPVAGLKPGDPVTVAGLLRKGSDGPVVTPLTDESGDVRPTPFRVLALVVESGERGTWRIVRGTLKSVVDENSGAFEFLVDRARGVPVDAVLTGQLYESSRIFRLSRDAGLREISAAELLVEDRAVGDSVYIPPASAADAGTLRIALMLSRTPADTVSARGELLSVNEATGELRLATPAGDRCVTTDADTRIFEIFVNEDSVEIVPATLGDLDIGSMAGATGVDDGAGCLAANIVIAEGQTAALL